MKDGSTKTVVTIGLLVAALAFYFVLLGRRGIELIQDAEQPRSAWGSAS